MSHILTDLNLTPSNPLGTYSTSYRIENFLTLDLEDRLRHLALLGLSGTGKSTVLENLAIHDMYAGHGLCFLDPHGQSAEWLLKHVPPSRLNDLVFINTADTDYAVGFNPLYKVKDPPKAANDLTLAIKGQFESSWGARMEHILRHSFILLMENDGSLLSDLPYLYYDDELLAAFTGNIKNPETRRFWLEEWPLVFTKTERKDAARPIINKISAWLTIPQLCAILLQRRPKFTIEDALEKNLIVIVSLSQAAIGEDGANLLGSMLMSQFQTATFARQSKTLFSIISDEHHNFTTPRTAKFTSQSRKYFVGLTLSSQWLEQMDPKVVAAIVNSGTIMAFRLSPDDIDRMAPHFHPIEKHHLAETQSFHAYVKLHHAQEQFFVKMLPRLEPVIDRSEVARRVSRERYGRAKLPARKARSRRSL